MYRAIALLLPVLAKELAFNPSFGAIGAGASFPISGLTIPASALLMLGFSAAAGFSEAALSFL
ncbi:hypothetical protein [Arcanobacterium hippocoleae]|uniref:hypothetical protein n=1 Tax=Arcanobacterium hippocoleae TaxID=149017 RepID=UPI003341DA98